MVAQFYQQLTQFSETMSQEQTADMPGLPPSKEEKEEQRVARLVREQTRKVLFDELGLSKESIATAVSALVDKLATARIEAVVNSPEFKAGIHRRANSNVDHGVAAMIPGVLRELMKERVEKQVPESHLREIVDNRVREAAKAHVGDFLTSPSGHGWKNQLNSMMEIAASMAVQQAKNEMAALITSQLRKLIDANLRVEFAAKAAPDGKRKLIT